MGSSVPAVYAFLETTFAAALDETKSSDDPREVENANPYVLIGGVTTDEGENTHPYLGGGLEYESYSITCQIRSDRGSQAEAREDAFAVWDLVRAAVSADLLFGGAVNMHALLGGWSYEPETLENNSDDDGGDALSRAVITFVINVKHQLT